MHHRHLLTNEIDLLLDGEAGFGVTPLHAHADACADCRARLDEARVVAEALERLPHFAPRSGFADRVMSQVQVIEPWHLAALDTARRFVPDSPALRMLAVAGVAIASATVSASAVWIAFSTDLTIQSATFVTGRARTALVEGAGRVFEAVLGGGAADAVRSSGSIALFGGAAALLATVGAAAFGFRALTSAARKRRS